jgi:hypothetical protein
MRIKCRAWDEKRKGFWYFELPSGEMRVPFTEETQIPACLTQPPAGLEWEMWAGIPEVDLWAGDIFQVAGNHKYIVRYCGKEEHNYELRVATFVLHNPMFPDFPLDEYALENGVKIGNIHKDPELIKDFNNENQT